MTFVWKNIQKPCGTGDNFSLCGTIPNIAGHLASIPSPNTNGGVNRKVYPLISNMPPLGYHSSCWLPQASMTTSQMWITATQDYIDKHPLWMHRLICSCHQLVFGAQDRGTSLIFTTIISTTPNTSMQCSLILTQRNPQQMVLTR